MASWITWRQPVNPQYEELVEKATSPLNLPYPQSEDIALNLEICDMIRSKTVNPKQAMQSLKTRLASKNGRVQMSALGLTDTCIKNGGDHFLQEIASKEFVDEVVGMIKSPSTIPQVRDMALRVFQSWALAFESKRELGFLPEMYRECKAQGIVFPPPTPSLPSAALLSTATPPTWIDSESCMRCRTPFSFTNRKHHCRNCGLVFDQQCSSKMTSLPKLGIMADVRVCEGCWVKSGKGSLSLSANDPSTPAVPSKRTPRSARDMDADLQRAIALSLADAHPTASGSGGSRPGYVSSKPRRNLEGTDDEDEELRMAIEASLAEVGNVRPSAPGEAEEEPEYKPLPTYDLSPREAETMLTFAQTIEHAVGFGDPDLRRFPHAHGLYDQANMLSGKLHRNIEEKSTKQQMLAEMNDRLLQTFRRYDSLLTEQDAYSRRQAEIKREQRQQHLAQYGGQYAGGAYAHTSTSSTPAAAYPQYPYATQASGPERSGFDSTYPQHAPPVGQQYPQSGAPHIASAGPSLYPAVPQGPPPQHAPPPAFYPSQAQDYPSTAYPAAPPPMPTAAYPSGLTRQDSIQAYPIQQPQYPVDPYHQPHPTSSPPQQTTSPRPQSAQASYYDPQAEPAFSSSPPPAASSYAPPTTYQAFPMFPQAPSNAFQEAERPVHEQPKEAMLIDLF